MDYWTDDQGVGILVRADDRVSEVLDRETGVWRTSPLGVECQHGERTEMSLIEVDQARKIAARWGAEITPHGRTVPTP